MSSRPSRSGEVVTVDESPEAPLPLERCAGRTTVEGDVTRTVISGGRERRYRVVVPPSDGETPLPLLLSFHGFTETGEVNRSSTRYDTLGRTKGFVTVYLDGVDRSWNASVCCAPATSGVDDVRFVAEVIASLSRDLCIDERRVYASGFSNGGMLSYRLACELGDRIAAIGVVGATMASGACSPPRAVPVIHVHGTLDPVVPMPGNSALGFQGAEDVVRGWASRNRCASESRESLTRGNGTCVTWEQCQNDAQVTYCKLAGTYHTWPSDSFPASEVIWDFFAAHPMSR